MWGQWIGKIEGDNQGQVTLNIDRDRPFEGWIVVVENSPNNLTYCANIVLKENGDEIRGKLSNFTLRPYTIDPAQIVEGEKRLPKKGTLIGAKKDNTIRGRWTTNIKTAGKFSFVHFEKYEPVPADSTKTWDEFKRWVLSQKRRNSGLIYRGHSDSAYTLQTSFHRHGRRDLFRYCLKDVPELTRTMSATIGRSFSLTDAVEYGECLYLAQHHGYPTPLLDWTESPYVATFFSFHGINKHKTHDEVVRIYQFDKDLWHKKYKIVGNVLDPAPSFSALYLHARDNERALPQQSVVTFSNIFNIELFIRNCEQADGQKYLKIVDINTSDRNLAMKDLEIMGITESSLFPGLDGACKALREKRF